MAARSGVGASTLSHAAAGERLPTLATLLAYVRACGGDVSLWEGRWRQTARELAEEPGEGHDDADAPYRGLNRFEPSDQHVFYGRGRLTQHLVEAVASHRLTAVVGASGSGKSSLLRAGLVPALRSPGHATVRPAGIRILTPGPHPVRRLSRLEPAPGESETVVIIDQFEELFTLGADLAERAVFLDRLLTACAPGGGLRGVLAVRADFFGRCAEHPALAEALRDATVLVGPMSPSELREVVVKPATAAGLIVERDLTRTILNEVAGETGCLPLLSHALLETWRRRRGRALTTEMYRAAGGLHGAIAHTAESAYAQLSPEQADAARRILLRLVTPGEGAPDTRCPVARAELDSTGQTAQVVEHLVRARLLALDGDTVDLAHEALIAAWPRYRMWIEEDREVLRAHRRLTEAARAWQDLGRDDGALYRGAQLAAAEEVFRAPERRAALTRLEASYLDEALTQRVQEVRSAARATRRLRALTTGLAVLLALALTAGAVAVVQSRSSDEQRRAADRAKDKAVAAQRVALSRQLAARADSLFDTEPDVASLLAVAAYRTNPTREATASLTTAAALPLRRRLTGGAPFPAALAFSSDGRLATGGSNGSVALWDPRTGRIPSIVSRAHDAVASLVLDSGQVVVSYWNGKVEAHSAAGGVTHVLRTGPPYPADPIISANGQTLISGPSGKVTAIDLRTGRKGPTLPVQAGNGSLALTADGRTMASAGEHGVTMWNVWSGTSSGTFTVPDGAVYVALSADGRTVAAGSGYGRVHTWDVATRHENPVLTVPPLSQSAPMALSPDGLTLAMGDGNTVHTWDVQSGHENARFAGHSEAVEALAFSPDGHSLATASDDGSVRLWRLTSPRTRFKIADGAGSLSQNGRFFAYVSGEGELRELDTESDRSRVVPADLRLGRVFAIAVSDDGGRLAVAGYDHLLLMDADASHVRSLLTGNGGTVWMGFSPDDQTLFTLEAGDVLRARSATSGLSLHSVRGQHAASAVVSPDGHTLATMSASGLVRLWDARTLRERATLDTSPHYMSPVRAMGLAYSDDGRTLAAGTKDGRLRLFNTSTWQAQDLDTERSSPVTNLAFDPDGGTVAVRTADGTTELLDTATGRARSALSVHTPLTAMAFESADTLITVDADSGETWDVKPLGPPGEISAICHAVHRSLTRQERAAYLPEGPVQRICS